MKLKTAFAVCFLVMMVSSGTLTAQDTGIKPVSISSLMPDFTLPSIQGGEAGISGLKGKNIMLIFPRGKVSDHWCQICHYQYAELVEFDKIYGLREKFDLEILFVLPYGRDEVKHWVEIFPHQMSVIEGWKNPPASEKENEKAQRWAEYCRKHFPKQYQYEENKIPTPFPILIDADRKVSEGLGLFRTEWDRSKVDQNVSTVYIIDREGLVRFKYFSQNTFDRPAPDYLISILNCMIK